MNSFKKTIFSILLFIGSYICTAQEVSIRGGLNLSKMPIRLDGQLSQEDSKLKSGYHVGPVINFPFNKLLAFETGLLYSIKGLKELRNRTIDTISSTRANISYLLVPVTMKAVYPFKDVLFFGNGGGYVASGLYGDILSMQDVNGIYGAWQKIVWGDQEGSFRRLDYGLNLGLGVIYKSVQFGISYELGLANLSGYKRETTIVSNRTLEFHVSYLLWKKLKNNVNQ